MMLTESFYGILPRAYIFWAAILVRVLLKRNVHISSYFQAKVENMPVYCYIQTCPFSTIEMQLFPQAEAI